ncbi:MAG: hypothetical protein ACI9DC_005539 [Gammaproteobacteria bacterium]|jgi:hypothetical protein
MGMSVIERILCVGFDEINELLGVDFLDELEDRYALRTDKHSD